MHDEFNLFNKKFEEITADDLDVLLDVNEGWFIEYKREVPKNKNIAKSISSFSNQYGGWLFYGIEENKERKAGNFLGIDLNQIHIDETNIRNAVVSHLNPQPFYKIKVLSGPCQKINLELSKGIIVIYVPQGANPPYIHSSGVIYRRIGDSSEPKEETDRFILERLWEKGEKNQEYLKSKILDNQKNDEFFFLKLFLIRDLYGDRRGMDIDNISFENFSKVMKKMEENFMDIPFDNISSTINGYIARAMHENSLIDNVLTFRYSPRITKITTSVNSIKIYKDNCSLINFFNNYDYNEPFMELINKKKLENFKIIDLNSLLWILIIIMSKYKYIMDIEGYEDDIYAKILLENTFHVIPYIDSKIYIKFVKENMLPIVQENNITILPGFDYKDYLKIDKYDYFDVEKILNPSEGNKNCFYIPQIIIMMISQALGIPSEIFQESLYEVIEKTLKSAVGGKTIYNMNWNWNKQ